MHTREVVVEFGQEKTGSPHGKNLVFLANPYPIFPEKRLLAELKKTQTYDESIYLTNNRLQRDSAKLRKY